MGICESKHDNIHSLQTEIISATQNENASTMEVHKLA